MGYCCGQLEGYQTLAQSCPFFSLTNIVFLGYTQTNVCSYSTYRAVLYDTLKGHRLRVRKPRKSQFVTLDWIVEL